LSIVLVTAAVAEEEPEQARRRKGLQVHSASSHEVFLFRKKKSFSPGLYYQPGLKVTFSPGSFNQN
jgi:hypothetical protein